MCCRFSILFILLLQFLYCSSDQEKTSFGEVVGKKSIAIEGSVFVGNNRFVFLKDTKVYLYFDGSVESGILGDTVLAEVGPNDSLVNKEIEFNEVGELEKREKHWVKEVYVNKNKFYFAKGTEISFYPSGMVRKAVLATNKEFYYPKNKDVILSFPENSSISFYESGEIESATIDLSIRFPYRNYKNFLFQPGATLVFYNMLYYDEFTVASGSIAEVAKFTRNFVLYEAAKDSVVEFYPSSIVKQCTLEKDTIVKILDQEVTFKAGTELEFYDEDVRHYNPIKKGILLTNTKFMQLGTEYTFQKNSEIEFHPQGMVKSGRISKDVQVELARHNVFIPQNTLTFFYPSGRLNTTITSFIPKKNRRNNEK